MTWLDDFQKQFDGRRSQHRSPGHMIYCLTEGAGLPVKIGSSRNLKTRLSQFQVHTWRTVFLCWTAPGGLQQEWALKHALKGLEHSGEWFRDERDFLKTALPANATELDLERLINETASRRCISPLPPEPGPRKPARVMPSFFAVGA